jgi:hypothetical protein
MFAAAAAAALSNARGLAESVTSVHASARLLQNMHVKHHYMHV